jgi:glycosyltransferase involved in cell wall biosynthesis
MYKNKTICVVVPAHNEEKLIGRVIETMPGFVDKIVIVDDKSSDRTVEKVNSYLNKLREKLVLIQHKDNQGVGGAIVTGYKWALDSEMDITAVMAGDAQMDPDDLPTLIDAVIEDKIDYAKGNRLFTGQAWQKIPRVRYLGNSCLSLLTKIASGYWHVADSQTGYTAITIEVLKYIDLDAIYKRYGMPNDLLVHINIGHYRVKDIPINPVYNIGEKSGIRLWKVIPTMSRLLLKRFFWRLLQKYVIRDFHPLIFFYLLGLILFPVGLSFGAYLIYYRIVCGPVAATSALFASFLFISGLQSLFFAMWFDMEYNKDLK